MTRDELLACPLVLVGWDDIVSTQGNAWADLEDLQAAKVLPCYTAGWLIRKDRQSLALVSTVGLEDPEVSAGGDTIIPMGCVRFITRLAGESWHRPPRPSSKVLYHKRPK